MLSLRLRATLAVAAAAFTAACGGGDGSSGPSFPDSVSTADAEDFANGVANYANYVSSAVNFGGPSIALSAPAMAARLQAAMPTPVARFPGLTFRQPDLSMLDWRQAAAKVKGPQFSAGVGCTVTAHGFSDPSLEVPVDANGNDIPDDLYIKIDCEYPDTVAVDTVVTGYYRQEITWKEITSSLYGQIVSYRVEQGNHDNHGRHEFLRHDIGGHQDIRSTSIVDEASFKVRYESNISGDLLFEEAGESWSNAFDPASSIAPESNIPDGDLTIGGRRYYANSSDLNLSFSISTTDPLAYSAACALANTDPPFSDGTLLGKLNNSSSQASFQIDFTSCGNYTVAVNGAYDEPVVVSARP